MKCEVFWYAVFGDKVKVALNERQEVIEGEVTDVIASRVDVFFGEEFLLVCDILGIGSFDDSSVRNILDTAEYHYLACFSFECTAYTCGTDSLSFVDICL